MAPQQPSHAKSWGALCVEEAKHLRLRCFQVPELELKYKSCYARILDSKRRFLEAATRYYELSQASTSGMDGDKVNLPAAVQISCSM